MEMTPQQLLEAKKRKTQWDAIMGAVDAMLQPYGSKWHNLRITWNNFRVEGWYREEVNPTSRMRQSLKGIATLIVHKRQTKDKFILSYVFKMKKSLSPQEIANLPPEIKKLYGRKRI